MTLFEQLTSAIAQVAIVVLIGSLVYGSLRVLARSKPRGQSLSKFLGFVRPKRQFDRAYVRIALGLILFSIVSTSLQFAYSDELRRLLVSESSPYGKILREGFGARAILAALIYCFVQASLAEEVLFRGLIGRSLVSAFGFRIGNFLQALVFWIMHLIIFRLITGGWISFLQLVAFVTSFGLGLILGYVNQRNQSDGIAPSWILHGAVNFATFLTLAALWPK